MIQVRGDWIGASADFHAFSVCCGRAFFFLAIKIARCVNEFHAGIVQKSK
jgi:hypothetical protein